MDTSINTQDHTKTVKSQGRKPRGRQDELTTQRTRKRIIECATTLFAAHGFGVVSMRDIAAAAEVTHGLLRHHFGSKEGVWQAVIDAAFAEYLGTITPLVEAALDSQEGPLFAVMAVMRTVVLNTGRYPAVPRLLLHESTQAGEHLDYVVAQFTPLRTLMTPLIDSLQQHGYLQQFSHDTFLLSLLMLGVMPFALSSFSSALCGTDMLAGDEVQRHADRVIATFFPTT